MKGKRREKDPTQGGRRAVPLAGHEGESPPEEPAAEEVAEKRGVDVLRDALRTLPASPGVYRMINRRGDILYVGKARHLKRRVTTYTQLQRLPIRLQRMVAETRRLEVISTASEVEALLLESNLIKRHRPRYNVLLRDDKSFPYILLTKDEAVPRLTKHRGAHKLAGDYFGPFASAGAVNRTITALEKAFLLRSCSDAVFSSRTRPCLLYQIKRCSAPCVGRINLADYQALVEETKAFLTGRAQGVKEELAAAMEAAAEALDFELAARYRDRLRALAHIQSHQDVNLEGIDDADVIAAHGPRAASPASKCSSSAPGATTAIAPTSRRTTRAWTSKRSWPPFWRSSTTTSRRRP